MREDIMAQCIANDFNLVDAHPWGESAEQVVHGPVKCERRLLPNQKFLFTGLAAFHKLQEFVEELSKTTAESLDVVVTLLPQNLAIREIRYTEANTVFLCEGDATNKFKAISIRNGHPFDAAVDIIQKRSLTRFVTEFTNQLYPVPGYIA